ncbi:protein tyrosine kinase [Clonorchis sinensis]|uniref:Protein tyrosine kinase n=1 Tax=Clonorchis sinensis TaxID=79923 RepID=G7YRF6_CLOSI|nr:protein tyrosine kinase [Clonorchis sinensis]
MTSIYVKSLLFVGPQRIYVGDCSGTDNNAFNLYPSLSYVPENVEKAEPDLAPCPSVSKKAGRGATLRRKLRANMQMMARASQSEVFRFNHQRSARKSVTRESKRTKRSKRSSRKSLSAFTSDLGVLGDEGYYNMNVSSDCCRFDDMGSLDNDNFLYSLEKAVFPGLVDTNSSLFPAHRREQPDFWSQRPHKRTGLPVVGTAYPGSDYRTLASADLSLGSSVPGAYWAPIRSDTLAFPSVNNTFRFPAPGPPVAGWAHQLAQSGSPDSRRPASPVTHEVLRDASSSTKVALATGIIPPPFSPAEHRSRFSESSLGGHTSSMAIPRRRAAQKAKTRQMSEPRKESKAMEASGTELTYHSQQGRDMKATHAGHPASFGSETTLASMLDTTVIQYTLQTSSVSDNPVDSGYHDSMIDTSLELSTQCSNSPKRLVLHQTQAARSPPAQPPPIEAFLLSDLFTKIGCHPLEDTVRTSRQFRAQLSRGRQRGRLLPDLSDKLTGQYFSALADITTSQSSNGTSNESADSRTVMLSNRPKERSTSVSRQRRSEPDHAIQQHYRSPSYPDFYSSQFSQAQSFVQRSDWSSDINNPSGLSSADQENIEQRGSVPDT